MYPAGFAGLRDVTLKHPYWTTSTWHDTIPTLGISEAFRYLPPVLAALLIGLFSIEHLVAQFT